MTAGWKGFEPWPRCAGCGMLTREPLKDGRHADVKVCVAAMMGLPLGGPPLPDRPVEHRPEVDPPTPAPLLSEEERQAYRRQFDADEAHDLKDLMLQRNVMLLPFTGGDADDL